MNSIRSYIYYGIKVEELGGRILVAGDDVLIIIPRQNLDYLLDYIDT